MEEFSQALFFLKLQSNPVVFEPELLGKTSERILKIFPFFRCVTTLNTTSSEAAIPISLISSLPFIVLPLIGLSN
jgi:hypothetical protein